MNRIIDDNGNVIPDVQDTDVHNAYWLMKRGEGDFHKWLADPKGAAARIAAIEAERKAKEEKAKTPKKKINLKDYVKNPDFVKFAKEDPEYGNYNELFKTDTPEAKEKAAAYLTRLAERFVAREIAA